MTTEAQEIRMDLETEHMLESSSTETKIKHCYYCNADISLEDDHSKEGADLKQNLSDIDITESEALDEGLICSECIEQYECEYCGALGGERFDFDYGMDPETGYRDAGSRCSFCVSGFRSDVDPEAEAAAAERALAILGITIDDDGRPARIQPQPDLGEMLFQTAVAMNKVAAEVYRKEVA